MRASLGVSWRRAGASQFRRRLILGALAALLPGLSARAAELDFRLAEGRIEMVEAGARLTPVVTLATAAPSDVQVRIGRSDPAAVSAPESVTVRRGEREVRFSMVANTVARDTRLTLSASVPGVEGSLTLMILAPPSILDFTLTPAIVVGGQGGSGTVTLSRAAGFPEVVVSLASSGGEASVRVSVGVGAGRARQSFGFTTQPVSQVAKVKITAASGSSAKSAELVVEPRPIL